MQEAKDYLVDKEVENVLRKSHHDQFSWMENFFNMKLRDNLDIWPSFVEICERRNLLTHTGGYVSQQYLDNCKSHKHSVSDIKIGDKLSVSSEYFSSSVNVISEIGIKLCYVMWRKFSKKEKDDADIRFNHVCFDLMIKRSYNLAEALSKFGVEATSKNGSERTKRMLIVNQALAARLQDRKGDAEKIIDKEDWSATGLDFQICSNAAKGNIDEVLKLMPIVGSSDRRIDATCYGDWPVFRGIRKEPAFRESFKEIFGQELFSSNVVSVQSDPAHIQVENPSAEPAKGEFIGEP